MYKKSFFIVFAWSHIYYIFVHVHKFCNVLSSIAHAAVVSQSLLVDLLVKLDFWEPVHIF